MKDVFVGFSVLVLILGMAGSLEASIFVWTDSNGVKHFSDTQPERDYKEYSEVSKSVSKPVRNSQSRSVKKRSRSTGGSDTPMKKPVRDECSDYYTLIEGVCVFPTAMSHDGEKMKADIARFKRSGKVPSIVGKPKYNIPEDRCERAKKKLERYLRDGVMGIGMLTRKMQKMTGQAAEDMIQSARDDVDIFCND